MVILINDNYTIIQDYKVGMKFYRYAHVLCYTYHFIRPCVLDCNVSSLLVYR